MSHQTHYRKVTEFQKSADPSRSCKVSTGTPWLLPDYPVNDRAFIKTTMLTSWYQTHQRNQSLTATTNSVVTLYESSPFTAMDLHLLLCLPYLYLLQTSQNHWSVEVLIVLIRIVMSALLKTFYPCLSYYCYMLLCNYAQFYICHC